MKRIFFLVRFFDNPDHADDFVRGRIFANSLSRFKQIEGDDRSGRMDRNEGTAASFQPDKGGRLVINGMDISDDLAGPLQIQMSWLNPINIFCIHAVHSGDLNLVNLSNRQHRNPAARAKNSGRMLVPRQACSDRQRHGGVHGPHALFRPGEWLRFRAGSRPILRSGDVPRTLPRY